MLNRISLCSFEVHKSSCILFCHGLELIVEVALKLRDTSTGLHLEIFCMFFGLPNFTDRKSVV